MSLQHTLTTSAHRRYIGERATREDQFLKRLHRDAEKAGLPPISITFEQAALMQILLRVCGAREVIEVGCLGGYSAIAMARALPPGGRVRTIEINPKHADFAERWIAKSDVADRVQVFRGAGADILPAFADGSADASFLDADKKNYPLYLEESLRILRPGGLVMVDNAFAFGELFDKNPKDREVGAVRKFNDVMAKEKRVQAQIVAIGDGMWVGAKK